MKLGTIGWIALILVVIGAINWGLVGLFGLNLVAYLFGEVSMLSKVIYILVGLSGIYILFAAMKQSNM